MDIKDYTWVTGKIINRPWGVEYRYTMKNSAGKYFDDIVLLENENVSEETIAELIIAKLGQIDIVPEIVIDPIEQAKEEKESEIKNFLVTKELLTSEQTVWDIKSKTEILLEGGK